MNKKYCIINSIIFGVILNILLPLILKRFALREEIRPSSPVNKLSYKSQFMHMMFHHNKVPFISSLIVAVIVGLSVYLGYLLKPVERIVALMKPKLAPIQQF